MIPPNGPARGSRTRSCDAAGRIVKREMGGGGEFMPIGWHDEQCVGGVIAAGATGGFGSQLDAFPKFLVRQSSFGCCL